MLSQSPLNKDMNQYGHPEIYTIHLINDGTYLFNGYEKKRVYRRHELLRVDVSEGKDG